MAAFTGTRMAGSAITLGDVARHAFVFLNGLGTHASTRAILNAYGYTRADHYEGWRLLLKASTDSAGSGGAGIRYVPAVAAVRELDATDVALFHTAHAALVPAFRRQAEFVFADLAPSQGGDAVLGVRTLLDRLDALETGDDADQEAIAMLTAYGVGPDERARLRELADLAQTVPDTRTTSAAEVLGLEATELHDLAELYAWYSRWATLANAVLSHRADLIALGLVRCESLIVKKNAEPEPDRE